MKHKKICALAWSECWHKEPGYLLRACRVHSMNPRSTWHLCEFACSRKWNHYKKAALNGDYTKSILDWSLVLQECVLSKNCDGAKNAIEPRAEEEEGMSHEALLQSRKLRSCSLGSCAVKCCRVLFLRKSTLRDFFGSTINYQFNLKHSFERAVRITDFP